MHKNSISRNWQTSAHEKELTLELNRLYDKFQKWKENKITSADLNEALRQYHNDTADEIYKTYVW